MTAVRRLISLLAISVALQAMGQQKAATTPAPTTVPPSERVTAPVTADTDRDVTDPRALKINLETVIQTAIKQNYGIELQRFSTMESSQLLVEQWGIYDPLATADLGKRSDQQAVSQSSQSSSSRSLTADLGLAQNLPTGGSYTIGASTSRETTSGGLTLLSPSLGTGLNFGLTQPLARNFGIDINRRNITLARNTLGISREEFRRVLLDTTNNAEQAYYDLVYARQYVDVVKEAVFLARDQARITQIRIDVGASAPLDILQPRVQIATTEEQLIAAVANVRTAEDQLRQFMNLPADEWGRPIVPTESVVYTPVVVDVAAAVDQAMALRPEIRENQLTTANSRVQYLYARNQVLPQVDFVAGYGVTGTAGRAVTNTGAPIPGVPQTNFGDALKQVFRNDNPGWNVGLNIGVPIFNITARAEARRSQLDVERNETAESQTRQTVTVDVRSTARAIDTAAKEITASRAAREAAEQNLGAEQKRYENGMSTNFQVLTVQQQLSDARASELQALVGYNKAVTAYHRAVGDLLDVRGIAVEEPAPITEPSIFTRWDRYNFLNFANQLKGEEMQR